MARRFTAQGVELFVQSRLIWIPQIEIELCLADADKFFPRETGGAFMGYWSDPEQVVVTAMITGGPEARHGRYSFEPDQQWQVNQIAEHYERSGRTEVYLGDWHTHPGASSAQLSKADLGALRRIIRARRARAPRPVCVIFFGQPQKWRYSAWIASERRSLIGRSLMVAAVKVHAF